MRLADLISGFHQPESEVLGETEALEGLYS